ncbi:RagB/SusD family nutrient uptake outer membrane protein [Polaribacter reichenbachii]|uniref:Carbohydrate-binding protein SusD n=1 Tax=Polaribacter reichenbachii TaxID=996801 RepID=A0A1B8U676_9FLAO|nr:RagB/SusD family nutrient uptake outer membrane protein [Polaribacter reichenbachii]OBY67374.1 hypothetical protein LPB301_03170 [Polaribacter reichenbachii]
MKKTIFFTAIVCLFYSCSSDYLNEKPEDFLSSANAFTTYEDFDASVSNLYGLFRHEFYTNGENKPFDFMYSTDLVFDGQNSGNRHSNFEQAFRTESSIPREHWNNNYKIIAEANTIIDRTERSDMTADQITEITAQARFFRGFTYRNLAYLFGGVPLVTEEIISPKTDFVRATKEETLLQAVEDLEYASQNLSRIANTQDGRINDLVAYHHLAEVYLALGRTQEAITAASKVIDDPATALMRNRFGSRANETPGDVYWDLFRRGNQNRAGGNTEALWVVQFELDVLGGGIQSTSIGGSYRIERHFPPLIRDFKLATGSRPFSWPVGDYTGGRGIGWAISTTHFSNTIWESDFDNDIRNANHNFVREYTATNPSSSNFGTVYSTENPPAGVTVPSRAFYAYQSKCTTPFNHPDGLYNTNSSVPFALTNSGGGTYTDWYQLRLAETYLLRAEAYLADSKPDLAAADINVVRRRANASDVLAADVDIDYILDERMRELGIEEKRRLTLGRLGLIFDRVSRFNPYYDDILPTYNLWPIPFSEIERNRTGELTQNPGYN